MKISIIIPVFNVEKYIENCVDSIINQSYKDLEIILVNDGSEDNSGLICDQYKAKDSRIKVIHKLNGGVSTARNEGLKNVTGEYITFVDSDDWIEKNMYEKMCNIIETNSEVNVVMCDFVNIKNSISEKISSNLKGGFYNRNDIINEIFPNLLVTENFGRLPIISACTCLFKKSILVDDPILFDSSLKYAEDYLFMAEVMLQAESFFYLKNNYFYNYRQYEESRSKKFQPDWWSNLLSLNNKFQLKLSNEVEYDFSNQIKLQLIHSALFVSSEIFSNRQIKWGHKVVLLKQLFNDGNLIDAFKNINIEKKKIGLRVVLFLVRHKSSIGYLYYRKIISIIKAI